MPNTDLFNRIREEAQSYFSNSRGSHDWEHTERVYNLCIHIGKKERANLEILGLAAILHDIGRELQDRANGEICHAEKGAMLARELLEKHNLDNEKIDEILHCIECHRFRGKKVPQTKEAKILFDADNLDSIGAVGVGRAFLFAGEIGAKLHNKDVDIDKNVFRISILIPVFNEEKNIKNKIENLLAQNYPENNIEIIIASDGSEDQTVNISSSYESKQVKILDSKIRKGKNLLLILPKSAHR